MKKLLIVSLMLLSLLSLAACGTAQPDPTDAADSTNTADSSQAAADPASPDAQDQSETNGKIRPLPDQVAAQLENNTLTDGKVAAALDASSLKETDGQLQLTFTVYNYEEFLGAEITGLKEGDVIEVSGKDLTVNSVTEENGYITVNGGEEDGGVTFAPDGEAGTYYVMGMDDSKTYYEVGQLTLPVADTCVLTDDSDPDDHGKTIPASDLAQLLAQEDVYGFTAQNTTVTLENSQVTALYRSFLP